MLHTAVSRRVCDLSPSIGYDDAFASRRRDFSFTSGENRHQRRYLDRMCVNNFLLVTFFIYGDYLYALFLSK